MRHVKLSYVILIPFLALLLTVLLLLGSANEISLTGFFSQSPHGAQRGASLPELWRQFQLTVDAVLTVVLNGKLILFFFVSLFATAMTGLFAWKAFQIYRRTPSTVISSVRQLHGSAHLRTLLLPPWVSLRSLARGSGLVGKLGAALSALLVIFGLAIFATVYDYLYTAIQTQISRRAMTTAQNLSRAAGTQASAKKKFALYALVGKYSIADEVAYIFITDHKGKVLVHNLPAFSRELDRSPGITAPFQKFVRFRGDEVLETAVPIPNPRLGVAYYGVWKAAIDRQVNQELAPILGIILGVVAGGIAFSVFQARRIARPILVLKEGADRISRGEFDRPVGVQPFEYLGELASSLERLRSSLKAAFVRLNRE